MNNTTPTTATLKRCLNATNLVFLGIGSIIGAGIFVLTGVTAATQAGPGILISLLIAGVICCLVALCYAELASTSKIDGCGGAYSYTYYACGRFCAWLIGWVLLLQCSVNVATVASGWSSYIVSAAQSIGIHLPKIWTADYANGGYANLPAMAVIFMMAMVLAKGTAGSARFNEILVVIKLAVIAIFIAVGATHLNFNNFSPFLPFGPGGIIAGAGMVFFVFIGFDAVAAAAEETIDPQRNLPIGILVSLAVCTIIYVVLTVVLLGMVSYQELNNPSPIASALTKLNHPTVAGIIALGAVAGITTSILAVYYGFTRIALAMSRDKLLPAFLVHIHQSSGTPRRLVWLAAIIMSILAGIFPILTMANLVNLCTLFVYSVVCFCVIRLRVTQPTLERTFSTPLYPIVPILGIISCCCLMAKLSFISYICLLAWLTIGCALHFARKN